MKDRNISIIKDSNNNKIVMIHDIRFKGKRSVCWEEVEEYLKEYIGEFFEIAETKELVYIGKDLTHEFKGSKDTHRLKGGLAKAKANAASGIPELIEIASNRRFKENLTGKHQRNAKFGWFRYDSRFALPVYGKSEEVERYNVFHVEMLIRHSAEDKLFLYDIVNIKKETSTPPRQA
ncbi:hypothetical protein [Anaerosporobacter sp.]|uniref:hypothetical protein n=1 Tax=Anaerosporobacter sp. TaxID=1872529 RepID=UPI00286EC1DD|nr:hypothetical protein [Anaerosporobacter sp.]